MRKASEQGELKLTIEGPWAGRLVSNPVAREWLQQAFQEALNSMVKKLGGNGLYIVQVEALYPTVWTGRLCNCAISWTESENEK